MHPFLPRSFRRLQDPRVRLNQSPFGRPVVAARTSVLRCIGQPLSNLRIDNSMDLQRQIKLNLSIFSGKQSLPRLDLTILFLTAVLKTVATDQFKTQRNRVPKRVDYHRHPVRSRPLLLNHSIGIFRHSIRQEMDARFAIHSALEREIAAFVLSKPA